MENKKKKFDYKWVILCVCFMMNFFCLGFCSSNRGLYLTAITEALDIERSLFSINDSFRFVTSAVVNLFFGAMVYRMGFRKMAAAGFVTLIAAMLTYAFADHILIFYIGGILLGIAMSLTSITMTGSIIRRWFTSNVGKYTGIVFAANGIGGAVAAQIVTPMIYNEADPFGYRSAYLLVASIILVTGIIVVCLLRERPEDQPITVTLIKKRNAKGRSWDGLPFKTVKTRPYFYIVAVGTFLTGFILQGIGGVYAAHLKDVGITKEVLATVSSIYSLALTGSKLLVGYLYDKFGLRVILIMCQSATVIAFICMLFVGIGSVGVILAFIFALLYAIALPLETLVIPLVVNELFGTTSYDKVLGVMTAVNYAGYALGAPTVNLFHDILDSYQPAFIMFIFLMPVVGIMFQYAINAVNKDKIASAAKLTSSDNASC